MRGVADSGGANACAVNGGQGPRMWAQYNGINQMTGNSQNVNQGQYYDASGDITNDGVTAYLYEGVPVDRSSSTGRDGEGRICAVRQQVIGITTMTQYIYDAEGRRVAKTNSSGAPTSVYVLGLGGEQVTELNGSGGWVHTNVFAGGGRLLATYEGPAGPSPNTYHYHLTDWLGTNRMQANASGNQEEVCYSYPFGDGLLCKGTVDSTEHHFTGKERDTESGLDYFGARYFTSDLARWMTPDWAGKPTAVPYASFGDPQTLNLYGYVGNNPLFRLDPDGHDGLWQLVKQWLNVVEITVSASVGVKVSGQWGVAKTEAHATLVGVEGITGLGGGGKNAKVTTGIGASASAGPGRASVSVGAEASTKDGASASASAKISAGAVGASASASVDKEGTQHSAGPDVSKDIGGGDNDSKVGFSVTDGVGLGVAVNFTQLGNAVDATADSINSLGSYLMDTFVSPALNGTPTQPVVPAEIPHN